MVKDLCPGLGSGGTGGGGTPTGSKTILRGADSVSKSSCQASVSATQFLGATVKSFSSKLGWGSSASEVTIDLVEDNCTAVAGSKVVYDELGLGQPSIVTAADPGFALTDGIGHPEYFTMGTFSFNGLVASWEENVSMNGCTYSVRLVSPTVVLSNVTLVLKGLDDFAKADFNLINVYKEFGKQSWCYEAGCTWQAIRMAVQSHGVIVHRGVSYTVSGLGSIGSPEYRFSGSSTDLMGAIDRMAKASGQRVYLELGSGNVIKVVGESLAIGSASASVINESGPSVTASKALELGGIKNVVTTSQTGCCGDGSVISSTAGQEAPDVVSEAMTQGEFEHRYWQIERKDDDAEPEPEAEDPDPPEDPKPPDDKDVYTEVFEPWFGLDPETAKRIEAEKTDEGPGGEDGDEWKDGHKFTVGIKGETFGTEVGDTYQIHTMEIRAAMEGYDNWYEYMAYFRADILKNSFGIEGGKGKLNKFLPDVLISALKDDKLVGAQEIKNVTKDFIQSLEKKSDKDEPIRALFEFVASYGSFYGQKFYIKLPEEVSCCRSDTGPDPVTSYEQTDSGYPLPEENQILDLSFGHDGKASDVGLEMFKSDDGRVGPILQFLDEDKPEGTRIDISKLSGEWYSKGGSSKYWVSAQFEKIHIDKCEQKKDGKTELTAGVVLGVGGGLRPIPENPTPSPVKGLAGALMNLILEDAAGDDWDDMTFEKYLTQMVDGGHSLRGLGLSPRAMLPKKAGVPLKSNKYCYGGGAEGGEGEGREPWSITVGQHGKVEFEQNSSLNPWNFGGYKRMILAGAALTFPKVNATTVVNQGSKKIQGMTDIVGLGSTINGAPVTSVNISIGMGGTTTTIQYRTFIRNFGDLAQNRVEFMEFQAKTQQTFQRAFNLKGAEKKNRSAIKQAAAGKGVGGAGVGGGGGGAPGGVASHNSGAKKSTGNNFDTGTDGAMVVVQNYPHIVVEEGTAAGFGSAAPGSSASWPSDGLKTSGVLQSLHNVASELQKGGARWGSTAGITLDGLFRPFHIKGGSSMAEYSLDGVASQCPDAGDFNAGLQKCCSPSPCPISITSATTNPFMDKSTAETLADKAEWDNGHDMTNVLSNSSMGENGIRMEDSPDSVRPVGLRGPVVIVGWGYDTKGFPVPNKDGDGGEACKFIDNWLVQPDKWKAGPLDVVWDNEQKNVGCKFSGKRHHIIRHIRK